MTKRREGLGVFAALFAGPLVLALKTAADAIPSERLAVQLPNWMVLSMLIGVPVAFAHLFIGIGVYWQLVQRWRLRWWSAALGGALVGGIPIPALFFGVAIIQGSSTDGIGGMALNLGLAGLASGLAFWLFARGDEAPA
ncbi:hypothetical protein [Sphingomonas sp.]|uniref:hypothetical protein n=1 Tax=Sphingomonas sp. TaxID=28214 RepID=UPI001B0F1B32|nr:hypothetical protein [Sphingomonas sp.]MBO9711479.1 hypothetical protein [Sphingomonas sp.]